MVHGDFPLLPVNEIGDGNPEPTWLPAPVHVIDRADGMLVADKQSGFLDVRSGDGKVTAFEDKGLGWS